jgi:acyl-CoA thioester hydrolase
VLVSDARPDREPERRERYPFWVPITTRWSDNDAYGHVNNVVFYSYFDTAANRYLIEHGGLDLHAGPVIGLVVESSCRYRAPIAYPQPISAGVRVDRLGKSSVTYGIAIFVDGVDLAAADGTFTHVFVDRATRRPAPIPPLMRAALERITRSPS